MEILTNITQSINPDQHLYAQRKGLLAKTLLKQHPNISWLVNILYSVAINQAIFYFLSFKNVKIKIQDYKFVCKFIQCSKGLNKKG
jgi:hypothetical protein